LRTYEKADLSHSIFYGRVSMLAAEWSHLLAAASRLFGVGAETSRAQKAARIAVAWSYGLAAEQYTALT
jgi:hypothetical protein